MSRARAFVSLGGQDDNLGDSVLRRGLLGSLQSPAVELHVFVGRHSQDYLSGLGLDGTEYLYRDYNSWRRGAITSALTRRTLYVHNAGEIQLNSARARNALFELAVVLLTRARGIRPVLVGVGVRNPQDAVPWAVRAATTNCRPLVWRDEESLTAVGVGEVGPDWAFGLRSAPEESDRPYVAIGMRFDRPRLTAPSLARIDAEIRESGLTPLVVSQVRRDVGPNQEIASQLGCEHITWAGDADHAAQEKVVRAAYRRCAAVVSDRLHALIIGGTEGAAVLPLVTSPDRKLGRTLKAGGLQVPIVLAADGESDIDNPLGLSNVLASAEAQQREIESAALRVNEVGAGIARIVRDLGGSVA